jgi:hypothetical protein
MQTEYVPLIERLRHDLPLSTLELSGRSWNLLSFSTYSGLHKPLYFLMYQIFCLSFGAPTWQEAQL